MTVRIVRLGTPRLPDEGLRIGTVRHPPRGVRKERFAEDNWYDVWYPELSPTQQLIDTAHQARTEDDWKAFQAAFRRQMKEPAASRTLDLLAALSKTSDFSVGCYCEIEEHCHRFTLRALLGERGAVVK